jgi:hypothetical protein
MKLLKTQLISVRIITIFMLAISSTFITELLPGFFGDYPCDIINLRHPAGFYPTEYAIHTHWGYRHWLYFMMCFCLFIVQAVDLIKYINKEEE